MSIAEDIRNYVAAQPLKLEPVPTPFWPQYDGQVFMQDMPGDELMTLQALANRPNVPGQMDSNTLMMGALVCKALVCREADGMVARIWPDESREDVAKLGATVLAPVFKQLSDFFGLGADEKKAASAASSS